MKYPTPDEINKADRTQICRWYRFLPSPNSDEKILTMTHIVKRFNDFGGFTPEISKHIGFGQ